MKKKVIIVILILCMIGAAVAVGLHYNKNHNGNQNQSENGAESEEKIPELNIYYGSEKIGRVDGYLMEMEQNYLRDTIIPVAPSRHVPLTVVTNDNNISSITYTLESVDDRSLIDSGEFKDWQEKKGKISLQYEASAIMTVGMEYFFNVDIETKEHGKIHYYTRAMVTDQEFVEEQVKFARNFSDSTFDESKAAKLAAFMEPDLDLANDNLGQITIQSNYNMLTWKNLNPEKVGDTTITAKEFCIKDSGEAGTYTMNYQIKSTNAQKVEETYNVEETITVWTIAGQQYVLAYDREVNQIWEATENNIGNSFIDLGIQNHTVIEHAESANQQYISYEINGDVYVMNIRTKQVQCAYRLGAKDSTKLEKTRARVIGVSDEGNVNFMIYGYSPSAGHRAKSGISIMEYNREKNESTEAAFIPCALPAEIMENLFSQLCYVGDGTLYIMMDNTVYFANLRTKEWGTLVPNLEKGACVISDDGATIAYNTNGSQNGDTSITIVNLATGQKNVIEAEDGYALKVCGYTGLNLVYGEGKLSPNGGVTKMSRLKIMDSEFKEIKSYEKKGITITGVEITETIINIKRAKKGKAIDDDQLLDNTEEKTSVAESSYYNDDVKLKELALSFTNNLDESVELKVEEAAKISFSSKAEVNSAFEENKDTRYYVYGYGKLQGIYSNQKQAISAAKDAYGLVTDQKGVKIWVFEENYND